MLLSFIKQILGKRNRLQFEQQTTRPMELTTEERHRLEILDTFMSKLNELSERSCSTVIRQLSDNNRKANYPFLGSFERTLNMDAFLMGSHVIEGMSEFVEHVEIRQLHGALCELGTIIASDPSHRYMLIERLREEMFFGDDHAESDSSAPFEYQFAAYNEEVYLSFKYYIFSKAQGLEHVNTDRVYVNSAG